MPEFRKTKRRRYIPFKKLQYSLVIIQIIYFLAALLVVSAALFVPLFLSLNDKSLDNAQRTLIAEITLYIHARFWPAFIAVSAILVCHSILVSHRIAGPLYRFRVVFRQIAEGKFSDLMQIRKYDYLHEEKDLINEMSSSISSKLKSIKTEQCTIQTMLSVFRSKYKAELGNDTCKDLSALEDHFHRLEKEIDYFKLDKSV